MIDLDLSIYIYIYILFIYSFIVDNTKEKKQPAENISIILNIMKIKESVLFALYENYKKYFLKH